MKTLMVRYTTSSPEHAETNAQLVRAVFDELRARSPEGIRYATYRLPDGVTFIHLATHAADTARLTSLPAFQAFQAKIKERCSEPPVVTELSIVDSYGSFARSRSWSRRVSKVKAARHCCQAVGPEDSAGHRRLPGLQRRSGRARLRWSCKSAKRSCATSCARSRTCTRC